MADVPRTIDKQQAKLEESLTALKTKLLSLLSTLQEGSDDGPIARYFNDFNYDDDDGPYEAVDQAWTRTFRADCTEAQRQALLLRGQDGLQMVYTYLSYFSKQRRMVENNGLSMLHLWCTQLLSLVENT
ncbi:hypothetical protein K439DRAFT_1622264 [Ramaria rubella]|nr:hypothetical protein K439DRAFT_1622264 [Ramaria rubella]